MAPEVCITVFHRGQVYQVLTSTTAGTLTAVAASVIVF
jgi:hypothetical protein